MHGVVARDLWDTESKIIGVFYLKMSRRVRGGGRRVHRYVQDERTPSTTYVNGV